MRANATDAAAIMAAEAFQTFMLRPQLQLRTAI